MQNLNKKGTRHDKSSARFGQRIPLELLVGLSADGVDKARGIIRSASISGAFIETALELPLHTNLVVTLQIPGPDAATHTLNGCVVRLDAFGLGIEWRDMASVDVIDLLQRAIAPA
jgi:hypothetical protein